MSAQIGSRLAAWMLVGVLGVGSAIASCTPSPEEPAEVMLETEVVTLYVGPETVECVGVAPQDCLQVRYAPEEDYQLFYSAIEGFIPVRQITATHTSRLRLRSADVP